MELHVQPEILGTPAGFLVANHAFMQRSQGKKAILVDACTSELCRKGLQSRQHNDHRADVLGAWRHHARATGRYDLDQFLARQRLQRLAHRRTGNAELGAYSEFRDDAPGWEAILGDACTQPLGHVLVQRAAAQRGGGWAGRHGSRIAGTNAADRRVRVVVLEAAGGRAFSVGADIAEFEASRGSREAALRFAALLHRTTTAMRTCRHPVVAAIDGLCVGGGLEIAVSADLRLATETSRFGLPIKRLGLPIDYGELATLRRLVGPAHALARVLEGRIFEALGAWQIGLLTRMVPASSLQSAVAETVAAIAEGAPLAARMHKRMIDRLDNAAPLADEEREAPFALFDSADYREGTRAFLEKREPVFQGI